MDEQLQAGDRVSWESEAGEARGKVTHVHKSDIDYKGRTHRASPDDPQYEIRDDLTRHFAIHSGAELRKIE